MISKALYTNRKGQLPALEVEAFEGKNKYQRENDHPHDEHRADNRQEVVFESKCFLEIILDDDVFRLVAYNDKLVRNISEL